MKAEITMDKGMTYPCLMKGDNCVVLMHEERKGMIVCGSDHPHGVGHYHNDWSMNYFTPFNGEITLSND